MNNVNDMCVICSSISMSSIDHIYPREIDNKMHESAYRHSLRLLALRGYFDRFNYFKHPINLINRCWLDVLVFFFTFFATEKRRKEFRKNRIVNKKTKTIEWMNESVICIVNRRRWSTWRCANHRTSRTVYRQQHCSVADVDDAIYAIHAVGKHLHFGTPLFWPIWGFSETFACKWFQISVYQDTCRHQMTEVRSLHTTAHKCCNSIGFGLLYICFPWDFFLLSNGQEIMTIRSSLDSDT